VQRFTREGLKTHPWAGTVGSAQEEFIATDGEDGAETQGNHRLRSFAKVAGGVRVGPCRGTSRAQCPPSPATIPRPRSVQGWIHEGSQLTELKKAKIKLMVRQAETQELLSGSLLQHVPTKGKTCQQPAGLLGSAASTPRTIEKATSLLQISILPCWETASAPSLLLLPSLASTPAAVEMPRQRRGADSCALRPHDRDPKRWRDGTSRGIRPAAARTCSGREEKMESRG